jgi:hypothetical protein
MEVAAGDAEGYVFVSNEPTNTYVNKIMGYAIKHWATTNQCTPQEAIIKTIRDELMYLSQLSGIPIKNSANRIVQVVYKILTKFNGRSYEHNMAIGYIMQYFMKLRLGIIPTEHGSINAFKLACDQYYTHKVSNQTTMGTTGQLESAGSGWKIFMILVVNEHLKFHKIPSSNNQSAAAGE